MTPTTLNRQQQHQVPPPAPVPTHAPTFHTYDTHPAPHVTASFLPVGTLHQAATFYKAVVSVDLDALYQSCRANLLDAAQTHNLIVTALKGDKHMASLKPVRYPALGNDNRLLPLPTHPWSISTENHKYAPHYTTRVLVSLRRIRQTANSIAEDCDRIKAWTQPHLVSRDKRSVAVGIAIFAAGAALIGVIATLLSQPADTNLWSSVNSLQEAEAASIHAIAFNTQLMSYHHKVTAVEIVSSRLEYQQLANRMRLQTYERALSALQHQRLELGVVSQSMLTEIYSKAARRATETRTYLPFHSPAGLLELPCVASIGKKGLLEINIFAPLVQAEFRLYKANPSPVVVTDGSSQAMLFHVDAGPNLLAVNKQTNNAITPTRETLDACIQVSTHYICSAPLIDRVPNSCLECLYFGQVECAQRVCAVNPAWTDHAVQLINKDSFRISVTTATTLRIRCGVHTDSVRLETGSTIVHVAPGCTADTSNFIVSSPDTYLPPDSFTAVLEWDIRTSHLANLTDAELHETNPHLFKAAAHLLSSVQALERAKTTHYTSWGTSGFNFALIAVLAVALYFAYRSLSRKKNQGTPAVSYHMVPTSTAPVAAPAAAQPAAKEGQVGFAMPT